MTLTVYLGHDTREEAAFEVATATLWDTSRITPVPLVDEALRSRGLLTRIVDQRDPGLYDLASGRRQSTEFAISRFLVPLLAPPGFALFCDCDVVFLRNVHELLSVADPTKAVQVVKHQLAPSNSSKMVDQVQRDYPRKNWSSVVLWNVDHPANRRLTLHDVNTRHRDYLHGFEWLSDSEIGSLDPAWNWLVNVTPKPPEPAIAHFTLGGPWIPGWDGSAHDEIWLEAARP